MTCVSCCGLKRAQDLVANQTQKTASRASDNAPLFRFEYFGKSRLAVVGTQTGKTYHFEYPGVVLTVDGRDRVGLANIPVLREVTRSKYG